MTIRAIDIGQVPNDGTGDDLREAFAKVNENFTELNNRTGPDPFAIETVIGAGESIFAGKIDNTFQLKNVEAGDNVTVTSTSTSVKINSAGGISDLTIMSDNGHITLTPNQNYLNLQGSTAGTSAPLIRTRVEPGAPGNSLFIDLQNSGLVEYDIDPRLSQSLDANFKNINNVDKITTTTLTGNLEGTVHGIDVREIDKYFENYWNFGEIAPGTFANIIDYLTFDYKVDMGTITDPVDFSINGGTI